jgi:hypothetical protein
VFPSPASGKTEWFCYHVPGPASVTIEIFNILGERCATVTDSPSSAGNVRTAWNIDAVAPGFYLYRLTRDSGGEKKVFPIQKLAVIKK